MNATTETVSIGDFGKDHWSVFGYLETRIHDYKGVVNKVHLRTNPERHPQFVHAGGWRPEYGTRLAGFFETTNPVLKASRQLGEHDDWNCLDDCEEAGLIENKGTGINRRYVFTDLGHKAAMQLREHKNRGSHFASFRFINVPV